MSEHKVALVPIESWCYNSPELLVSGQSIDLGLLAEALLYYDRVMLQVTNQAQFSALLAWTIRSGHFDEFLDLVKDGIVTVYDYSFLTAPFEADGAFTLVNLQDPVQAVYGTFPRRYLYHAEVEAVIPHARRRKRLYEAFRDRVYEVKADDFGASGENAQSFRLSPPTEIHRKKRSDTSS